MDTGLFKQKLRECNPDLYLDVNHQTKQMCERGSSGIYLKGKRSEQINASGAKLSSFMAAKEFNEAPDKQVGWAPHQYVTEGDWFDKDGNVVYGWRSIIFRLIQAGYVEKRKTEKAFGWSESTYDRKSYETKLEDFRKEQGLCPQQL